MSRANRHFNRLEYYPGYLPAEDDILEDTQHEEDPDEVADKIEIDIEQEVTLKDEEKRQSTLDVYVDSEYELKQPVYAPCPMPHAPCPMPHAPCPLFNMSFEAKS